MCRKKESFQPLSFLSLFLCPPCTQFSKPASEGLASERSNPPEEKEEKLRLDTVSIFISLISTHPWASPGLLPSPFQSEKKRSLGRDYHPLCLKCQKCNRQLTAGQHAEYDEKPYCSHCYMKMFGPRGSQGARRAKEAGVDEGGCSWQDKPDLMPVESAGMGATMNISLNQTISLSPSWIPPSSSLILYLCTFPSFSIPPSSRLISFTPNPLP
ncbi:hypothetical protein Q8A73_003769 [Channa argus]|nr:hypothetical protein Q8A73_003769 [Channa argus]